MSFSTNVKKELAITEPEKSCCQLAEIAGFLRVASTISLSGGGKVGITAATGDNAIARHFKRLLGEYFGESINLKIGFMETELFGKNKRYILVVDQESAGEEILRETGLLMVKQGRNYFTDGIYEGLVKNRCCKRSYLKGMFLGAGTVTNPQKAYHLEIVCTTDKLAKDLKEITSSLGIEGGKIVNRGTKYGVYFKSASAVSDVLGHMGAYSASLELQNIAVAKSMRAKVTKVTNCDSANLDRALLASEEQIAAINKLKENGMYGGLSPKLKELAELRLANPEVSMTQLGEMLNPPIKKSGVNNRFKRIFELAGS